MGCFCGLSVLCFGVLFRVRFLLSFVRSVFVRFAFGFRFVCAFGFRSFVRSVSVRLRVRFLFVCAFGLSSIRVRFRVRFLFDCVLFRCCLYYLIYRTLFRQEYVRKIYTYWYFSNFRGFKI